MKAKFDGTSFGSVTINGKRYDCDIMVLPNGKIEQRRKLAGGHTLPIDELAQIMEEIPDAIVIGRGQYDALKVPAETKRFVEEHKIELLVENTHIAIEKFNELVKHLKVGAIIHVTC